MNECWRCMTSRENRIIFTATTASKKSYDDDNAMISGRKFYWHNLEVNENKSAYQMQEANQLNSTMELVMPDDKKHLFEFCVYYDGITEDQLEKLMWCIHLGENNTEGKGSMGHKPGHGKPLGLGSVKFEIAERWERAFNLQEGYSWKSESTDAIGSMDDSRMANYSVLLKLMDMEEPLKSQKLKSGPNADISIEYSDIRDAGGQRLPEKRESNEDARHNWYSQNKNDANPMLLSAPKQRDQALCVYQKGR